MKKFLIIIILSSLHSIFFGQYISEVIEYRPAPGQLINSDPWGLASSANSIIGGINGTLSLGAFGGYVIFKFENPVENHPDNPFGIDFTIFGNPAVDWSEPAAVYVMKDENENGLPDDTWYELAGSDYYFSSSINDYEVTYINPGNETAEDVEWSDNLDSSGYINANSFHTQSYYPLNTDFPDINEISYSLSGRKIKEVTDLSNPVSIKSYKRAFGYADNQIRGNEPYTLPDNPYTPEKENSGGDAFDISWAVDSEGNYIDLDEIHFIKVQNAVNANADWLGEISTEITGAVDVTPDNTIFGIEDLIVFKDLPQKINTDTYQLEIFVFSKGRIVSDKDISLDISLSGASIDDNNLLTFTESGELIVTAGLVDNPTVYSSVTSFVELAGTEISFTDENSISIYPNPAQNRFIIKGLNKAELYIYSATGILVKHETIQSDTQTICIDDLPKGLYILKTEHDKKESLYKLIKQ